MATLTSILGLSKPTVGADADVWGALLNGNFDILDRAVVRDANGRVDLMSYSLTHQALGPVSGPTSLNTNLSNYFSATVTGNTTFSFANSPLATKAMTVVLELTNGGAFTVTWPTAVKWPGGQAPVLTTSGVDVLVFVTDDAGATYRGTLSQRDSR